MDLKHKLSVNLITASHFQSDFYLMMLGLREDIRYHGTHLTLSTTSRLHRVMSLVIADDHFDAPTNGLFLWAHIGIMHTYHSSWQDFERIILHFALFKQAHTLNCEGLFDCNTLEITPKHI